MTAPHREPASGNDAMRPAFTPFADLLAARQPQPGGVRFDIGDDWLQGRTAYGGLIAALGAQAMRDVAGAGWPADARLRSLQTSFIGPVQAGSVDVTVQTLREGKSVRQVQATVTSQGQLAALLTGVYASPRESALEPLTPRQSALRVSPDAAPTRPFVAGLMPSFLQHLAVGWAAGDPPYSGSSGWATSLYVRLLADRPDQINPDVLTVLLADAPPSPAVSRLRKPAPASSVCWALELLPLATRGDADGWWRIDSEARSASAGYVNHSSTLWPPAGEAAALGHQVVTVYG